MSPVFSKTATMPCNFSAMSVAPSFRFRMVRVRIGLRHHPLDFRNRNQRKEADKEEEERREDPERPDVGHDVDNRRRVIPPARRQEVAGQRGHDNNKSLKPHADVHKDRNYPDYPSVLAHPAEPEELRRDDITNNHRPISPGIRPERAI